MASVVVKDLYKVFETADKEVTALSGVSFEITPRAFVSIVGPSGCGKSTLLNILSRVEEPTSGTAEIVSAGVDDRIGYVFQAPRLLPWRTVIDNMMFVQEENTTEARERAVGYLRMVGLEGEVNSYPGQLSGGMQQRVGIARAFAIEPVALLMDEPFSHLDAISARDLRRELHELWAATQKTVVFVTHDVAEAVELSNRIIVLQKGGKVYDDIEVDLPFPREPSDADVAVYKANILARFDEISQVAE